MKVSPEDPRLGTINEANSTDEELSARLVNKKRRIAMNRQNSNQAPSFCASNDSSNEPAKSKFAAKVYNGFSF